MTYSWFRSIAQQNPSLEAAVAHPLYLYEIGRIRRGEFLPRFSEAWYASSLVQNAITSYDGIISARGSGNAEDEVFVKTTATGGVSGVWYSILRSAGLPASISPGAIPGGSVMNRASTGAAPLLNPATGSKYLLTFGVSVPSVTGFSAILLADILVAAANISANTISAQTVNTAALTRYTPGAGVMMILAVSTALGATASNVTISYTNSSGASGRSTGAIAMTASAGVGRLQPGAGGFLIPLQSGDVGVQSVQTATFSAAMGAGVLDLYLFKPLVLIPTVAANTFIERDSTVQIDGLTELVVGTDSQAGCLGCFALTGGATTTTLTGFLRTCNG
ncbi:MAG: hypothetical protein HY235_01405 [Acidobacteria bacterium]|nr:hypothetical protein [Acidobacteriota bacterium]